MAETRYILTQVNTNTFEDLVPLNEADSALIDSFQVNARFDRNRDQVRLQIYSLDRRLLQQVDNFTRYSEALGGGSAGQDGASILSVDPQADAIHYGYQTGDVILVYSFITNPFTARPRPGQGSFFVDAISPDRQEIRALSNILSNEDITRVVTDMRRELQDSNNFSEFYVDFDGQPTRVAINIATEDINGDTAPVVRFYEPIPGDIANRHQFEIQRLVADSAAFRVTTEVTQQVERAIPIRGANFTIDLSEQTATPTEYLNYNQLYSYPVTSSNYELQSLLNRKGVAIATDHTDFKDFIYFSSAEERLRNFKYKLDLIHSYESSIELLNASSSYTGSGASGSVTYYEGLISGLVSKFDHYDNYLYFESGSWAWPKVSGSFVKPYTNQKSSHPSASVWFNNIITSASNFDNTNNNILLNAVPAFIREDTANEPYLMFIDMLGHHFDNLWIYQKSISDKYDTDNRLDFGISKDIVRSAIESFGVRMYDSEFSTDNLLASLVGQTYNTGSEVIDTLHVATSGSAYEHLQPIAVADYQKEIYKRIYHNLPFLIKTKGTERGIRALVNCFGIPSEILGIRTRGGVYADKYGYFGPEEEVTSSLGKIRIDNTGSLSTGSQLSTYVTINQRDGKYTDDQHSLEVGFSVSEATNRAIRANIERTFDLDQYIGDPRDESRTNYPELLREWREFSALTSSLSSGSDSIQPDNVNPLTEQGRTQELSASPAAIIRLMRFFDNSLFRMINDFTPARSAVSTGVTIQSHILHRSKAKAPITTGFRGQYSGSSETGFASGSDGGTFGRATQDPYTTNYDYTITTPIGQAPATIDKEQPRYNGEFGRYDRSTGKYNSSLVIVATGELNAGNTFKTRVQPEIRYNLTSLSLTDPVPSACTLTLTAEYLGEVFSFYLAGSGSAYGSNNIQLTYPRTETISGSFEYSHDFDTYEYFSFEAAGTYPYTFEGWYTAETGGTLITSSNVFTLYQSDAETYTGTGIYARYSTTHDAPNVD